MLRIGQERHFNALLATKVDPLLLDRIRQRAPTSVIDVGAFSGEALCLLHHWVPSLTHMEGWESSLAEKVLATLRKTDHLRMPEVRYRTLYERYCLHVNEMGLPGWTRIATESEYKKIINVRYGTDPATTRPFLRAYDMIIMSNVLHTFDADTLVELIYKMEGLHRPGTLTYLHTKERPVEGFGRGNSTELVTRICERLAQLWSLRATMGPDDYEGKHMTYSDL